ncbi:putative RNA pseudouridine synthase slr1629 [Bienertia sinuspersici]
MAGSIASNLDSCEWEVINDDGFVYKRKKRRIDPTSLIHAADPDPDPAVVVKQRRKRKREALVKLKEKYESEICVWNHLSDSLKAMQESVNLKQNEKVGDEREGGILLEMGNEDVGRSLVDELVLQVEAQEAIIRNFEQLCDVADSLCNAQEDKMNQQFFNLPIWNSPRQLMSSLCQD